MIRMINRSAWMALALVSIFIAGCAQTTSNPAPAVKPSAPSGLRADSSVANTVDLLWRPTTEADIAGYNVYRSTVSGGVYSKIATVKMGTAFWDTGTIVTISDSSAWTPHTAGTGVMAYPLPFNPTAETEYILYRLTLNEDAVLTVYSVLGNAVWHRSSLAGAAGGMAGVNVINWDGKGDLGSTLSNGIYPVRLSSGSTNEADYILIWNGTGGLTAGSTYYYVVTAFNTSGTESDHSAEVSAEARADGKTHWPTRLNPVTSIIEYDPTLPSYR